LLAIVSLPFTWIIYGVVALIALGPSTKPDYYSHDLERWVGEEKRTYAERYKLANGGYWIKLIFGIILQAVLFGIGYAYFTNPLQSLKVTGFVLVVTAVIIGIIAACIKFSDSETKRNISRNIDEVTSVAVEGVKSFKQKYCPKIDWQ